MNHIFESIDQAITVLKDPTRNELERVKAVHFLHDAETPEAIQALIDVLSDDDYGVRWAAADALAKLGEKAAPMVLRTLLTSETDDRFREAMHHIFKENSDYSIRNAAGPLIKALGTSNSIDELTEASKLLKQLPL